MGIHFLEKVQISKMKNKVYNILCECAEDDNTGYYITFAIISNNKSTAKTLCLNKAKELNINIVKIEKVKKSKVISFETQVSDNIYISGRSFFNI